MANLHLHPSQTESLFASFHEPFFNSIDPQSTQARLKSRSAAVLCYPLPGAREALRSAHWYF
jgi:hypothetical protein